ncbi:glycerophosphodiester phosphodiesterase family protein [Microbulbifer sp. GL-2]|uniref:glycerophosphodiester phosphodiesterase family protein n=1 Tax=Microbulbifer sp. GL-2 TaxID=2591606 RepID=UPI0011620B20|nr:glycerophosphodiester phosphodiesterase family protein [Microbulbifer sp. GL-2]BBM03602.1 hypothetical protein GL2_36760 [Microbulbifer sp. GL-2]
MIQRYTIYTIAQMVTLSLLISINTVQAKIPADRIEQNSKCQIEYRATNHCSSHCKKNENIMIASHRGDWRSAPENSIAAIESAISHGADIVEIDIRETADGQLVLMHDSSVDRTTDGTGYVSMLTLSQLQSLRLRLLQGGETQLTEHKVPTFKEAIAAAKGRVILNLDKAWEIREKVYDELKSMDAVSIGLFKSNANPDEVQEFLDKDDSILYMHKLREDNLSHVDGFERHTPYAWEIGFETLTEPQINAELVESLAQESAIWINTLWYGQAAGFTDEVAHLDPISGWQNVIDHFSVTIIQTDNVVELDQWLKCGKDRKKKTIRVMAYNFERQGPGRSYYDTDAINSRLAARKYEGVDFCNTNGNTHMCFIRESEWVKYSINIPHSGWYNVSARLSARQEIAGTFALEFEDDNNLYHTVKNTSAHDLFMLQPIGERYFEKGVQQMTFRVTPSSNTNFNLQYFQIER